MSYASEHLAPQHFKEVSQRRAAQADKIRDAVRVRLSKEASYQQDLLLKYQEMEKQGQDRRLQIERIRKILEDLRGRRTLREAELDAVKHVVSTSPVVVAGALVIPVGLLEERKTGTVSAVFSADAAARKRIETLAMQAVLSSRFVLPPLISFRQNRHRDAPVLMFPPRTAAGILRALLL